MKYFIDAHQDLAYNILSFNRDYQLSVYETRAFEKVNPVNGLTSQSLLGWPQYNQGHIALVIGTLFAAPARREPVLHPNLAFYHTPEEANKLYWRQLKLYHQLAEEKPQVYRLIGNKTQLRAHLTEWQSLPDNPDPEEYLPIGIIPSMEGAEGITDFDELPEWWNAGLRAIGLAWAGNQFCGGTHEPGGLTPLGRDLLEKMAEVGFVLDLAHMDEPAAFECLDRYQGKIIASHANAASLVKGYNSNRLLSDELIKALATRDGVIGVVPLNGFLNRDWVKDGGRQAVSMRLLADQIDYICQLTGSTRHVGFGTDFDGGIGLEHVPYELDSIADLAKIHPLLRDYGYNHAELEAFNAGNFLRVLESILPE